MNKVSFLEVKLQTGVVIGIYNTKKVKITGKVSENFDPVKCKKYCVWFVRKLLKLESAAIRFSINNVTASFRVPYSISFADIRPIFGHEFKTINLSDQETPPYNITRMYLDEEETGPLLVALVHITGYFQIMGARTVAEVRSTYEKVMTCLEKGDFAKGEVTAKKVSRFAAAGIAKKRGRPSKKELELLNDAENKIKSGTGPQVGAIPRLSK